jgi:hypothetical protein
MMKPLAEAFDMLTFGDPGEAKLPGRSAVPDGERLTAARVVVEVCAFEVIAWPVGQRRDRQHGPAPLG